MSSQILSLNQLQSVFMYIKVESSLGLVSVMSQLLSVLCVKVCSRMADRWSWMGLCRKCQRVYHRYGEGSCEIPSEIADPLETFDDTNVEKNVMRFVVYILWLKRQLDSFEKLSIFESEKLVTICGESV